MQRRLTRALAQAWVPSKALNALQATRTELQSQAGAEEELHFGLRLFKLHTEHNQDLAACEKVHMAEDGHG